MEALLKGFNFISNLQQYWKVCEDIYLKEPHSSDYQCLVDALVDLYSQILEYQARVIRHISSAQLERGWQNIAGENDWDGKRSQIEFCSEECRKYLPALEAKRVQERYNHQLQEMEESRSIQEQARQVLEGIWNQT